MTKHDGPRAARPVATGGDGTYHHDDPPHHHPHEGRAEHPICRLCVGDRG
jgi:hypothetical protein